MLLLPKVPKCKRHKSLFGKDFSDIKMVNEKYLPSMLFQNEKLHHKILK